MLEVGRADPGGRTESVKAGAFPRVNVANLVRGIRVGVEVSARVGVGVGIEKGNGAKKLIFGLDI